MSPCVGMGRDKWTITWLSFTHVNTLQVCTVQKTEKVIYSRTITQGLNFTRSLFSVLLFIYILSQVTDIFLLMIANVYSYICIFICCMPTVILLYWLILWFTNRSELTSIKGSINQKNVFGAPYIRDFTVFFFCQTEQAVEQTVELSTIWDTMMLKWYHSLPDTVANDENPKTTSRMNITTRFLSAITSRVNEHWMTVR